MICYRVYRAPDGCCPEYCGEYATYEQAAAAADKEPCGLEEALWETARAAGHCAGLCAPDWGVEDNEPISWHGDCHCVVKVSEKTI